MKKHFEPTTGEVCTCKGIDWSKDNLADALRRPDLKPAIENMSQPMAREHILSKDCWCKPSVRSYCGKDKLFEQLAAIEHERWADWQKYMHSKCLEMQFDGKRYVYFPVELYDGWERQIATPYAELSEIEKESDRDQVWRYWGLI